MFKASATAPPSSAHAAASSPVIPAHASARIPISKGRCPPNDESWRLSLKPIRGQEYHWSPPRSGRVRGFVEQEHSRPVAAARGSRRHGPRVTATPTAATAVSTNWLSITTKVLRPPRWIGRRIPKASQARQPDLAARRSLRSVTVPWVRGTNAISFLRSSSDDKVWRHGRRSAPAPGPPVLLGCHLHQRRRFRDGLRYRLPQWGVPGALHCFPCRRSGGSCRHGRRRRARPKRRAVAS